jgi:hypothetical protein
LNTAYLVGVREVHVRLYRVSAKDEEEARKFVDIRGENVTDLDYSEYSHEQSCDTWSVEVESEKGNSHGISCHLEHRH